MGVARLMEELEVQTYKEDAEVFSENSDARVVDLVRCVSIDSNVVAGDEGAVDSEVFHDCGCHIVTDKDDVHTSGTGFIHGESHALKNVCRISLSKLRKLWLFCVQGT